MKKKIIIYQCPACGALCSEGYLVLGEKCPNCGEKMEPINKK